MIQYIMAVLINLLILILAEEDHIPFVEGSPIISKFGPISRSVRTSVSGASSQPVEVQAAEVRHYPVI